MNASAPAAVQVPGLDELVEMLRRAGLPVGASEAIDAALLLKALAPRVAADLQQREALKTLLRPVLCKRQADLDRFDRVFDTWAVLPPLDPAAAQADGAGGAEGWRTAGRNTGAADASAANTNAGAGGSGDGGTLGQRLRAGWADKSRGARWRRRGLAALAVGLVVWAVVGQYGWRDPQPPIEAPAPVAAPPPLEPLATPEPLSERAPSYGYFPRLRVNVELRPAWLLVLAALLALGVAPLLLAARELPRVMRGRGQARLRLEPWPAGKALAHLVPGMPPATEGLLQRHVRGSAEEVRAYARRPQLDLRRTVAATLERGLPTPRLRFARLRPAFLVLAEADGDEDVRLLWTQRLLALDARVEIFRLEPAPGAPDLFAAAPMCVEVGGRGRRLRFDALPTPLPGQRLVLCGRLALLFEQGRRRRPHVIAARLERWRERALFTHEEFGLWNPEQVDELETARGGDPGMFVFPLDDNALAAWGHWLRSGQLPPITLAEPINYPPSLAEAEDDFCDDADPAARVGAERAARQVRQLLSELQEYLGSNGLYWMAACAIPPLLDRRLALMLGEQYFRRTGASERAVRHHMALNWSRLTRLPWFREPPRQLPGWLRLALLERLPRSVQEELRGLVVAALDRKAMGDDVRGGDDPHALPLGFEAARAPEVERGAASRDLLYVGFVRQGLDADRLALRLPGQWRAWLPRALDRQPIAARLAAGAARLLRDGGVRGSGPGRGALALGLASLLAAVALVTALSSVDPDVLPARWRDAVVVERLRQVQSHGDEDVGAMALSPDGRWLVTTGASWSDSTGATLWDAAQGLAVRRLATGSSIRHMAWSPDSTRLAVFEVAAGTVITIDDSRPPLPLTERETVLRTDAAAFDASGSIVTAFDGVTLRRWSASDGRPVASAPMATVGLTDTVTALADDGSMVAVAGTGQPLRLLAANGDALWSLDRPMAGKIIALAVNGATRRVAVLADDGAIAIVGPTSEQRLTRPAPAGATRPDRPSGALEFSRDGRRLWAVRQSTATVFDTQNLEPVGNALADGVRAGSIDARGERVALSEWAPGQAQLFSSAAPVAFAERLTEGIGIARAEVLASGDWLLALPARAGLPGRLWQRGADSWQPQGQIEAPDPGDIVLVGAQVVLVRGGGIVAFDPETNTTTSLPSPLAGERPLSAALSGDGAGVVLVAGAGADVRIARVALAGGNASAPIELTNVGFERAFLSENGRLLGLWSAALGLRTYDTTTGQLLTTQPLATAPDALHWHGARSAAVRGNLITLAGASASERPPTLSHGGPVRHASFSPDGRRLASVAGDGALRVWSSDDGRLLGVPLISRQPLDHVAWTPDGLRVVASVGGRGEPRAVPAAAGSQALRVAAQQLPLAGNKGDAVPNRAPTATPDSAPTSATGTQSNAAPTPRVRPAPPPTAKAALPVRTPPLPAASRPAAADTPATDGRGADPQTPASTAGTPPATASSPSGGAIDLDAEWPVVAPGVVLVHAPPLAIDPLQHGMAWTRENVLKGTGAGGFLGQIVVVLPLLLWALWRAWRGAPRLWRGVDDGDDAAAAAGARS